MSGKPIVVGDAAPDFKLLDQDGRPVQLSDFRGSKVILYFYPRDDTPGCTKQACGFRDASAALAGAGAVVLGVSPDDARSHKAFQAKYKLPFPLLVDTGHAVADRYGAWGTKAADGVPKAGILRSHFVIDEEGRVADIQRGVSAEESVSRALASISS